MSQENPWLLQPHFLHNKIRHYAWGSIGEDAFIPKLLDLDPEPGRPYAELWMGAHPSAPSELELPTGRMPLDQAVRQAPEQVLGHRVRRRFGGDFPFLFKVLSADRALSIQAHPDRGQAENLHARDPEHYPDPNHKPELAVAIDSLTALAGFRSPAEIREQLMRCPELAALVEDTAAARSSTDWLTRMVSVLADRSARFPDRLNTAIDGTAARLARAIDGLNENERLFLELRAGYPGPDPGLVFVFLLNLVQLTAGEGLFIDAGVPHAYLRGNMVECMANSDNVVRLGLTAKFKDAETLVRILSYESGPVAVLKPDPARSETVYPTPAPDFALARYRLVPGDTLQRRYAPGPVVIFVLAGAASLEWDGQGAVETLAVAGGRSVFVPAAVASFRLVARSNAVAFSVEIPD